MSGPEEATLAQGPHGVVRRTVEAIVAFSIRSPWTVVLVALVLLGAAKLYTTRLELRSDFRELLPRDSPGFLTYEKQLGRVGGGASLIVVAESPDRAQNERFADAIAAKVEALADERNACVKERCGGDPKVKTCASACGPELVSFVEQGTKEVRKFFEENKWLYADLSDLEEADETLERQIAIQSGMVDDLSDEGTKPKATEKGAAAEEKKPALGMADFRARWKARAEKKDDFPTGYFETEDGRMVGIRIVSPTTGTGDQAGDILYDKVGKVIEELNPRSFHPEMRVGLAGDIPNAKEEKESIVSEAATATAIATFLILFGVFAYFRSFSAVLVMLLPTGVGIACAYSFATATFGYVNTSGAFLGAIILGNGINYPLVLLARYNEFVARGMSREEAKQAAVWNAFRAELVGASVAGIAYGSLVITRFRGFSQFGTIGFVGMLLVWASIIPLVPAIVTLLERARQRPGVAKLVAVRDRLLFDTAVGRVLFPKVDDTGTRGPIVKAVAWATDRYRWVFLGLAVVVTGVAAYHLPPFLHDPWEYNFARLGSRGSKKGGAGEWSQKSEEVFHGKMNVAGAMMLADTPEQVPAVKAQILANDAKDPQGKVIAEIATVYDLLPGTKAEQEQKLAVLERIRERITPRVLDSLKPEDRKTLEELRPPETLRVLVPKDLPDLMRRRFEEKDGTVGAVFYVKTGNDISLSDGHNLLRIAKTLAKVDLPDGTTVRTASRSTIFAEMIQSMERDGPLASFVSLAAVTVVVILATSSFRGALTVLLSLVVGVVWMVGFAAWSDMKLNFLNFIALPITFGIGCEYPFNIFDRSRLLHDDVSMAVRRSGGAVALCSYTTIVGYGSLVFADNQALQSFGHLAALGEITTLAAAMLFLPSLLHVWRAKKS